MLLHSVNFKLQASWYKYVLCVKSDNLRKMTDIPTNGICFNATLGIYNLKSSCLNPNVFKLSNMTCMDTNTSLTNLEKAMERECEIETCSFNELHLKVQRSTEVFAPNDKMY